MATNQSCEDDDHTFTFLSEFEPRPTGLPETEAFLFSVVFVISVSSNIVMLLHVRRKSSTSNTHLLLVNLCVSELLFTLSIPTVVVTLLTEDWVLGDVLCTMIPYSAIVCSSNLLHTLTVISFDRYLCIHKGGQHKLSKKVVLIIIAITWVVALLFCIPTAISQEVLTVNRTVHSDCNMTNTLNQDCGLSCRSREYCGVSWPSNFNATAFLMAMAVIFFVLPISLLCVFYVKIYLIVNESTSTMRRHASSNHSDVRSRDQDEEGHGDHVGDRLHGYYQTCGGFCLKFFPPGSPRHQIVLVRMSVCLVFSFLFLWTPFITLVCLSQVLTSLSSSVYSFTLLLAFVSSCVNPVLYIYFNPTCRKELKDFFKRWSRKQTVGNCVDPNRSSNRSDSNCPQISSIQTCDRSTHPERY